MKKQLLLVLACGWASLSFAASQIFVKTPENGGNDGNSGESWEAAKATIGAALSAVDAKGTVTVGPGTYTVTCGGASAGANAGVAVANGVKLISSEGPEKTIITQAADAGANSTVVSITDKAVVSGFAVSDFVAWGVYFNGAGTLTNCIVRNMSSTTVTSAIFFNNTSVLVTDCVVSNNICTATKNSSSYCGAGVRLANGVLNRCRVVDNHIKGSTTLTKAGTSAQSGAGIYMGGGTTRGCLVVGNSCILPGGSAVRVTKGTIESCTIAGNATTGSDSCGGLYITGSVGSRTVRNCIIYGNASAGTSQNYSNASSATVTYTCCDTTIAGEGNKTVNPNFKADWTLGTSACVDGGSNQAWMNNAVDLAGNDRIINEVVDLGCFERTVGEDLEVSFTVTPSTGRLAPFEGTLTANVIGGSGEGRSYKWEFNNPEIEDAEGPEYASVVRTFGAGTYSVKLTVTEEGASADFTDSFTVSPGMVYVGKNGSNTPPYDTPATAASSIADAIAAGADGSRILILPGTYELSETLLIDRAVVVGSADGNPESVTLDAAGGAFRAVNIAWGGAVLQGVTVTGATQGGVLISAQGTLSNCVITANAASSDYGAAVKASAMAVITDCRITDNESTYNSAYGFAVYLGEYSDCAIRNSVITGNRATANEDIGGAVHNTESATIRNTLIARNVSSKTPAGVTCQRSLTLTNCTILDNVCSIQSKYSCGINTYFVNGNHSLTLVNCIVSGNTNAGVASDIGLGQRYYQALTATTSLVGNLLDGFTADDYTTENVGCDPKVYRTASKYGRLKFGSPAVDAGTNQDWMTDAKDVFGKTRIFNETVDVGADELCETTPPGLMLLLR